MYKAIFFDRDGTLTFFTRAKKSWRNETISKWSGKAGGRWTVHNLQQIIDFIESSFL